MNTKGYIQIQHQIFEEEEEGEEEDPEAQLPQTFPHGLHPSSLEPGATDMQYPPTTLFREPPQADEESHEKETPWQQVVHLRNATQTMTRLVADLSQSLWARASDQERYVGKLTIEPRPRVA